MQENAIRQLFSAMRHQLSIYRSFIICLLVIIIQETKSHMHPGALGYVL